MTAKKSSTRQYRIEEPQSFYLLAARGTGSFCRGKLAPAALAGSRVCLPLDTQHTLTHHDDAEQVEEDHRRGPSAAWSQNRLACKTISHYLSPGFCAIVFDERSNRLADEAIISCKDLFGYYRR